MLEELRRQRKNYVEDSIKLAVPTDKKKYLDQLGDVECKIKMVKSETETIPSSLRKENVTDQHQPNMSMYLEPLKPPVFSGKQEDWLEFRVTWESLFVEVPDIVAVQYLKACIPSTDLRRIFGLITMKDVWYGNRELNTIKIKSNLEGLDVKSDKQHGKIIEVYEAAQYAVAQLENIDCLKYISEDFSLIYKLVMKLSPIDQWDYSEYVTFNSEEVQQGSRWKRFWTWLELKYKAALEMRVNRFCRAL